VVVAAILYFIAEINKDSETASVPILALALFGLILSVLGLKVMIALSLAYEHHKTDIIMIFYYWDKMELYRHPKRPVFFVGELRRFYEITIVLFAALSLYYGHLVWGPLELFHNHPLWLLMISAIIFIHIEGFYKLRWEQYFAESWRFTRILRNDTERRYENWDKWFTCLDFRRKVIEDAENRKKEKKN